MLRVMTVLLLSILSLVGNAKSITLEEITKGIFKSDYDLKIKSIDIEMSRLNKAIARAVFLPDIGVEISKSKLSYDDKDEIETTKMLYGKLNIFNGFADKKRLEDSELFLKSNKLKLKIEEYNRVLEVKSLYFKYLFFKNKIKVLSKELVRTKSHLFLVKKRVESKLLTETDLLEFKIYSKQLESIVKLSKSRKNQLYSKILIHSGLEDRKGDEIGGHLPHLVIISSLKEIKSSFLNSRRLGIKEVSKNRAVLAQEIARGDYYPKVDLSVHSGFLDESETGISSDKSSTKVVLQATWNIYSGGSTSLSNQLAKENYYKANYQEKNFKRLGEMKIDELYNDLKVLESIIDSEELNEKIAKNLYWKTLGEYRKGVKDSGALGSASKELSSASSRVFELKAKYITSKLRLEKILGMPLKFKTIRHKESKDA